MNSILKKLAVIAAICLGVGLIGMWSVYATSEPTMFSFEKSKTRELYDEKTLHAGAVKSINIRSNTADILVKESNTEEARVVLDGQKGNGTDYSLKAEQNGGELDIRVIEKNRLFMIGFHWSPKLTVYVPAKMYDQFNVSTDTGDVSLSRLTADQAEIETDTGDIKAEGLFKVNRLKAESETGDLSFNEYRGASLDLQTDTGDIQAGRISKNAKVTIKTATGDIDDLTMESAQKNVHIETNTGDVALTMEQPPASMELEASSSTGDISVSPQWKVSYMEKSDHKAEGKAGKGGPKIMIRSDTGDIDLN
ncbi:DUF4097 family beta strand repeat-containing protein [Fictibacillus fluitans]|uniref:DUF4097 family beta strand repeat-containing protein n=1 Tax=Fictibacillus fluitans TaxID=3058422 RepID=A0ABT8I2K7_9BACL|nr:DUF4097 family beta strand repeat-containing protein [Fictibacillus sp. NE201]MDN4527266.1 DUF4097 family beta strand repeat-containing protein [Fictibacillus sp. NE201]